MCSAVRTQWNTLKQHYTLKQHRENVWPGIDRAMGCRMALQVEQKSLIQCWFTSGPASATLDQH